MCYWSFPLLTLYCPLLGGKPTSLVPSHVGDHWKKRNVTTLARSVSYSVPPVDIPRCMISFRWYITYKVPTEFCAVHHDEIGRKIISTWTPNRAETGLNLDFEYHEH